MKWFKHYTNAHKGETLQQLYAAFGVNEGYAIYFRVIEYICDKWDGVSDPKFKILTKELQKFATISPKKFQIFAGIVSDFSENSIKFLGEFCEVDFPKLREILHKDALTSSSRRANVSPPLARGDKIRLDKSIIKNNKNTYYSNAVVQNSHTAAKEPEEFNDPETLIQKIPKNTKSRWLALYNGDEEFLRREAIKAFGYYENNPRKKPKTLRGWTQALSSWFERGWKSHVRSLPSQPGGGYV